MGEESATNQFRFASELDRIFESEEFARSPVMRRLLRFLVDQTLAGNGDYLKAYSVAVDGLGRDPDFDAQTDSYPRVQVGRLRRMLEAYYARHGFPNAERLTIPSGAYRVYLHPVQPMEEHCAPLENEDSSQEEPPSPPEPAQDVAPPMAFDAPSGRKSARWVMLASLAALSFGAGLALVLAFLLWPSPDSGSRPPPKITRAPDMLLLPVKKSTDSPPGLDQSVDQVLGDALHRSWVVNVQSRENANDLGGDAFAYRLQAVLAGPGGEDLYLTLWNNRTGQHVWTDHIHLTGQESTLGQALRLPVANIIGSFGAIAAQERQRYGTRIAPGYSCLLKNAELRMGFSQADLEASSRCLRQTLAAQPAFPTALAASAGLNYRLAIVRPDQAASLRERARAQVRQALLLNPYAADVQIVSAALEAAEGRCALAKMQGLRAIELNPYEPEYHAFLGLLLFQCGEADHENHLIVARQMNPQLPAFFSLPVIAAMGERGQGQEALRLALHLPTASGPQMPLYSITLALAHAHGGDRARARQYWGQLAGSRENAGKTAREILRNLPVNSHLAEVTGNSLLRAGVIQKLD